MATIGLMDLDLHFGRSFSLSLPLMHAYTKLMNEGHQVIMMKPYEKTGRYNKILYFKDNPNLIIPKKMVINTDKGQFYGYGFYGKSGLKEETLKAEPSFTPYDLMSASLKGKRIYNNVKANSLVDWREKDFSLVKQGKTATYVIDRNFLDEPDWEDIFDCFDNNIRFIRAVKVNSEFGVDSRIDKFLEKPYGMDTRIVVPATVDKDKLLTYSSYKGISFELDTSYTPTMFLDVFIAKVVLDKPLPVYNLGGSNEFQNAIIAWARVGKISFEQFMGGKFKDSDYYNFPYRLLLKQNPLTITYEDICEEYLVK